MNKIGSPAVNIKMKDELDVYVYVCDSVHGKGQHQLGQGERSFKEVLFLTVQANLACNAPLAVML